MNKHIVFDIVMFVVYLTAAFPAITGIPAHEWISIVATVLLVAHCAVRGIFGIGMKTGMPALRAARIVLNVLIALALAACAVSGIMISGTVLPTFGVFATGYYFWDPLHALSAKILLALLLIHLVLNGRAVLIMFQRTTRGSRTEKVDV